MHLEVYRRQGTYKKDCTGSRVKTDPLVSTEARYS